MQSREHLQMVHYPLDGHYSCHYDSDAYGIDQGDVRLLTVGIFLNDVEEGGETVFPAVGVSDQEAISSKSWRLWECPDRCVALKGLTVKPRRGDAVLFYNVKPNMLQAVQEAMAQEEKPQIGEQVASLASIHCGAPVRGGMEKHFANFWLTVPPGGFIDPDFAEDDDEDDVAAAAAAAAAARDDAIGEPARGDEL